MTKAIRNPMDPNDLQNDPEDKEKRLITTEAVDDADHQGVISDDTPTPSTATPRTGPSNAGMGNFPQGVEDLPQDNAVPTVLTGLVDLSCEDFAAAFNGDHLSEETLEQHLTGNLPRGVQAAVEDHLTVCEQCDIALALVNQNLAPQPASTGITLANLQGTPPLWEGDQSDEWNH